MKDINVLIVGVGGQGVILASDAMAEIGMNNGYDVKKSDSIGMAQRGGSVVSHIRWGEKIHSPIIKKGDADFLLGFEQLEAARWVSYLKPGGTVIVSDASVIPASVIGGTAPYPDKSAVNEMISEYTDEIYLVPATEICREAGNPRALNMVMLGSLSAFLDLEAEAWIEDIRRRLPPRFAESSLEAFSRGAANAEKTRLAKGA
ncbi:indolepyruvate oxidoreductase subunit beta [Chloroflexota bacterium]